MKILTESSIIDALNSKYIGNCRFKVANIFVFKHDWESDFFLLKDNGYSYEFEVKISRSDFKADSKKVDKHNILSSGKYNMRTSYGTFNFDLKEYENPTFEITSHEKRPNKFFYVVPENLVKVQEIPSYAGLMYVSQFGQLVTIKEAPFIHKQKLNFDSDLVHKFYHKWINTKSELHSLNRQVKNLEQLLEKHGIKDFF